MPNELNRLMEKELAQRYPKGTNFVVLGHEKLGGPETAQLRRALRDSKIRLEVVKNSVAVRVLEAHGLGSGAQFLQGPSVLATGDIGMPEMCKLLADCARKFEKRIFIRGGVMDSVALSAEGVAWLASIPPLPADGPVEYLTTIALNSAPLASSRRTFCASARLAA